MRISEVIHSSGTLTLINFARKHAGKLAQHANPLVAQRSALVENAAEALEQAYAARRPLLSLWSAATDMKEAKDDALDTALGSLSYELLGPALLKKNRDAQEYRALFPNGNLDFLDGSDRAELAHVAGMVAYLKSHASHPMASRAADLEAKADEVEKALKAQEVAEAAFRAAQGMEAGKRKELGRVLRKSVMFLRHELDGQEEAVNKLFPAVAEAKVADDPAEETPV